MVIEILGKTSVHIPVKAITELFSQCMITLFVLQPLVCSDATIIIYQQFDDSLLKYRCSSGQFTCLSLKTLS